MGSTASKAPLMTKLATGLELREGLSKQEWLEVGRDVGTDASVSSLRVGDWLVYSENFGDEKGRYLQAEELTGFKRETLYNLASVCQRVPISRRREGLTFGHYAAVAALDEVDQVRLIGSAAEGSWTVARLREEASKAQVANELIELNLDGVPRRIADQWTEEAKAADQPIWQYLQDQVEYAKANRPKPALQEAA